MFLHLFIFSYPLDIDMGHFGKNAVRISWLTIVYPSLVLNYLGQVFIFLFPRINNSIGIYAFAQPRKNFRPILPFHSISTYIFYKHYNFDIRTHALFWPIFVLGILATIIASQALISGAFSLTQQAVSLASFPRL